MIKIYKFEDLGTFNNDWLLARYHFSFSNYYNKDRMGFGKLRVINDDTVRSNSGFDTHPHKDMEIITYVRKGAITHKDSKGNVGKTEAGDVQVMSAGSGIFHSEHNYENEDTLLYQIWIEPNAKNLTPSWSAAKFPKELHKKELPLLVSGRIEDKNKNILHINQQASIYGGRIQKGAQITYHIKDGVYILLSEGEVAINDQIMSARDGAEVTDLKSITINAKEESEILIIDVV